MEVEHDHQGSLPILIEDPAPPFDLWLNLNGALDEMEGGMDDDGLFGASRAGSDTLLGEIEKVVRGREEDGGDVRWRVRERGEVHRKNNGGGPRTCRFVS